MTEEAPLGMMRASIFLRVRMAVPLDAGLGVEVWKMRSMGVSWVTGATEVKVISVTGLAFWGAGAGSAAMAMGKE